MYTTVSFENVLFLCHDKLVKQQTEVANHRLIREFVTLMWSMDVRHLAAGNVYLRELLSAVRHIPYMLLSNGDVNTCIKGIRLEKRR